MSTYALIMAGGEGTRFYPISTPEKPKQFLSLYNNATLLQHTYNRIKQVIPPKNFFVATNDSYLGLVKEQLPEIDVFQLVGEPVKKNTAPCIAFAAWLISQKDPNAIMCVFPADHFIGDEAKFRKIIQQGISYAKEFESLITLGIQPSWPSTEYGYIQRGSLIKKGHDQLFNVKKFAEKPKDPVAKEYFQHGGYFWNSGMFIWKAETILDEIKDHLPKIHEALTKLPQVNGSYPAKEVQQFFHDIEGISIDYGILERSNKVLVLGASFEWSDLGSFDALNRIAHDGKVGLNQELMNQYNKYKEANNGKQSSQKLIEKPWGSELLWAKTNHYAGKILRITKGHRLSYQYHEEKEETVLLLEGELDFDYESEGERQTIRLKPGDSFHIPPKMKHRMIAHTDCRVLEVSTPHLEDVVRLEDAYGRLPKSKY